MVDYRISELPAASTPYTGAEVMEVVQGGYSRKSTLDALAAWLILPTEPIGAAIAAAELAAATNTDRRVVCIDASDSPYTLDPTVHDTVVVDLTAGDVVVYLPSIIVTPPAARSGQILTFAVDGAASSNDLTLNTAALSNGLIDGAATKVLSTDNVTAKLMPFLAPGSVYKWKVI